MDIMPMTEMTKSTLSGVGGQKLVAVRSLIYCPHIFSEKDICLLLFFN